MDAKDFRDWFEKTGLNLFEVRPHCHLNSHLDVFVVFNEKTGQLDCLRAACHKCERSAIEVKVSEWKTKDGWRKLP